MHTRNYRDPSSFYAKATQPETPVGGVLRLTLPEPPTVNRMIELAKKRTRRTRKGGWMKKSIPVVYDQHQEQYEEDAMLQLSVAGVHPPLAPWPRWSLIRVVFRVQNLRDPLELPASLKWPVDMLKRRGWVKDDSCAELLETCIPTQSIDRSHRGVDLFLRRDG